MRFKDDSKRKDIINYTIDLVYREGIAGIKMAEISRKLGLSTGVLYIYFKNKEDLILSIFSSLLKEQQQLSLEQLQSDLPYKLKLKKIWLQWLNFSINNFKEKHFINQVNTSPYIAKIRDHESQHDINFTELIFEQGKREGLLKEVDNKIITSIMKAILKETVQLVLNKDIELNEENTNLIFSFAWDAIKS